MKFESIHPKIWEYAHKESRLGPETMMSKGIPWQEVSWARQIAKKEYLPIVYQPATGQVIVKFPDGDLLLSKKDLA